MFFSREIISLFHSILFFFRENNDTFFRQSKYECVWNFLLCFLFSVKLVVSFPISWSDFFKFRFISSKRHFTLQRVIWFHEKSKCISVISENVLEHNTRWRSSSFWSLQKLFIKIHVELDLYWHFFKENYDYVVYKIIENCIYQASCNLRIYFKNNCTNVIV